MIYISGTINGGFRFNYLPGWFCSVLIGSP